MPPENARQRGADELSPDRTCRFGIGKPPFFVEPPKAHNGRAGGNTAERPPAISLRSHIARMASLNPWTEGAAGNVSRTLSSGGALRLTTSTDISLHKLRTAAARRLSAADVKPKPPATVERSVSAYWWGVSVVSHFPEHCLAKKGSYIAAPGIFKTCSKIHRHYHANFDSLRYIPLSR